MVKRPGEADADDAERASGWVPEGEESSRSIEVSLADTVHVGIYQFYGQGRAGHRQYDAATLAGQV